MAEEPIVTLIPDGHSVAKIPITQRKGLYPDGLKRVTVAKDAWYEEIRVRQAQQQCRGRGRGRANPAGGTRPTWTPGPRRIEANRPNGSRRSRSATGSELRSGRPGCTSS